MTIRNKAMIELLLKRGRVPSSLQGLRGDFGVEWWKDFIESLTSASSDLASSIVTAGGGGSSEVIQTGTAAPTANATFVGQRFIDTSNLVGYIAVAVGGGAADWAQVTP